MDVHPVNETQLIGLGKQNLIFLLNYRIFNEGRFHYIVDGLKDDDWATMFLSFLVSLKEWRTEFGAGSGDEVPEEENQRAGETIEPPESTVDAEGPFGFLGGIRI